MNPVNEELKQHCTHCCFLSCFPKTHLQEPRPSASLGVRGEGEGNADKLPVDPGHDAVLT